METFLFDDLIFGPIKSRRLGVSLGINLLPRDSKLCNFNCVYCECGWTNNKGHSGEKYPEPEDIVNALIAKVKKLQEAGEFIDSITFAGNGEPTLHPDFLQIMNDVVLVRDLMLPGTQISVLTNATTLHKDSVISGLCMADKAILKLDAGTDKSFQLINKPLGNFSIDKIKRSLLKLKGQLCIQTLFFKGEVDGEMVDNTSTIEIEAWKKHILDLQPKEVMLYSIDRNTPANNLEAVSRTDLLKIAEELKPYHIKTLVA